MLIVIHRVWEMLGAISKIVELLLWGWHQIKDEME
jgi:hypothetical protein